jgi:hypothetical protein
MYGTGRAGQGRAGQGWSGVNSNSFSVRVSSRFMFCSAVNDFKSIERFRSVTIEEL